MNKKTIPLLPSDIEPDRLYSRTELSRVRLARGVLLSHVLAQDPTAPQSQRFGTAVLTKGADIIEYLNAASDLMPQHAEKIAAEIIAKAEAEADAIRQRAQQAAVIIRESALAELQRQVEPAMQEMLIAISQCITDKVDTCCGVYLLYNRGQLVYIGQSVNVFARIQQHKGRKQFDRVRLLPCSQDDLDDIEGLLIRVLQPPQNGYSDANKGGAPKSKYWRDIIELSPAFGLSGQTVSACDE